MRRRVDVIGRGAVSCAGVGVDALTAALEAGRSGIGTLPGIDLSDFPIRAFGAILEDPVRFGPAHPWQALGSGSSRNSALFLGALSQALLETGWLRGDGTLGPAPSDTPPERRGLYAALRPEEGDERLLGILRGSPALGRSFVPAVALAVARDLDLRGPHLLLHDACTTGTALLGEAFRDVREGRIDLAVVAAANADLTLDTICHYHLLGALSKRDPPDACRPFDRRRDGFVRAEGAACLVLASRSGAAPTGSVAIRGYGASADGYRIAAGHPAQRGLVLALESCLRDASVSPGELDHINAHGTGTVLNDRHEALALHAVLGGRAAEIPLTANKAVTGHASFASGLLEAVAAMETVRRGTVPPVAHFEEVDPELPPLDLVTGGPRRCRVRSVLSVSSAFGGLNAAVLLAGA